MKQCLNALNDIDILINKLTSNILDKHRCISVCNYLNIPDVFKDIDHNGLVHFTWEGSKHREKGIQTAKEEFASQKVILVSL